MKDGGHPNREDLIDLVDEELSAEQARTLESHIAGCEVCGAYVRSLKQTFSILALDTVPEPPPAFWAYFDQRVRQRIGSDRRRFTLTLIPGLAAAVALLVMLWWLPQAPVIPVGSVEIIVAEMTTGEIVETVSASPDLGLVFFEAAEEEILGLEAYLSETEDVYDLMNTLSDTEREAFLTDIERSMEEESTLQIM